MRTDTAAVIAGEPLAAARDSGPVLDGIVTGPGPGLSYDPRDLDRTWRQWERFFGDPPGSWGHASGPPRSAGAAERNAWREAAAGTRPLRAAAAGQARRSPGILRDREWRTLARMMALAERLARQAGTGQFPLPAGTFARWQRAWARIAAAARAAARLAPGPAADARSVRLPATASGRTGPPAALLEPRLIKAGFPPGSREPAGPAPRGRPARTAKPAQGRRGKPAGR